MSEREHTAREADITEPHRAKALRLGSMVSELPECVPARLVNEVLYCERLAYLEWVQKEFEHNEFTADGAAVHRRADRPKKLGEPGVGERPYQARSVWLSSERLGLTAKVDVVDVADAGVTVIEYKRGKRPNVAEGAYLPERAQLCAQTMLLREHGYRVVGAEIYFAADHKRVPIEVNDELEETVCGAVRRLRELAVSEVLPGPLEDSPKCNGCSLVGICLPDEVRLLRSVPHGREDPEEEEPGAEAVPVAVAEAVPVAVEGAPGGGEGSPRRKAAVRPLYAGRDDRVPLIVQEQGARVTLRGEQLIVVSPEGDRKEAQLPNTSQVSLMGNVQITTQAIRVLVDRGIPVVYFTTGGWFIGRTIGHDSNNVDLRLAQYRMAVDAEMCLRVARRLVQSKILNCRTLLRRNSRQEAAVVLGELKQLARRALEAENAATLLGIEGAAGRAYFQALPSMVAAPQGNVSFEFRHRNRRPPRDPVNALLSFLYSLLAREMTLAVQVVGLDPLLGAYHRPRFGRPALALDLMEELRPVIADSVVVTVINTGVVTDSDFESSAGGVALRPAARRRVIQAFERRMDHMVSHPLFEYTLSYRRVLEVQARLFSRFILGELHEYPQFRVR